MAKRPSIRKNAPPAKTGDLLDLIPRPMLFPDEDPATYEDLRQALVADLAPGTPYEHALAENLVTLEWEGIRHRRMRDALVRAEARDLATGFAAVGEPRNLRSSQYNAKDRAVGLAFVSADPQRVGEAIAALVEHDVTPDEIVAEAYRRVAHWVEVHERKLAEIETRRRRLREDYDRLKAARATPVEEAEIVE